MKNILLFLLIMLTCPLASLGESMLGLLPLGEDPLPKDTVTIGYGYNGALAYPNYSGCDFDVSYDSCFSYYFVTDSGIWRHARAIPDPGYVFDYWEDLGAGAVPPPWNGYCESEILPNIYSDTIDFRPRCSNGGVIANFKPVPPPAKAFNKRRIRFGFGLNF
jgi:hypothetical protein